MVYGVSVSVIGPIVDTDDRSNRGGDDVGDDRRGITRGASGRLAAKVAVVTGAGSGIGRAIADVFGREGARVLASDANGATAGDTAERIREVGGEAESWVCDVCSERDVAVMVRRAVDRFGSIDVLVNSAGINPLVPSADEIGPDTWARVLDVNLAGLFWCCRSAAERMREGGGGSIVNLASVSGMIGWGGSPAYVASKGGVIALTRKLATDWASYRVRVNCLCPGSILTPMVEEQFARLPDGEVRRQETAALHPLGRMGMPEEVAYGALYLASDESSFVTGTSLVIDGGLTAV